MSRWNHKEIKAVRYNNLIIKKIYLGRRLVWEILDALQSCFGSGYWINDRPWLNSEAWKNN